MRRYSFLWRPRCWPLPFPRSPLFSPPCTAWFTIPSTGPLPDAKVTLQAADSDFVLHATTNADGEFELPQAPIGVYRLTVAAPGFATVTQTLTVASGTNPVLHIPLAVGGSDAIGRWCMARPARPIRRRPPR